jgi:uncharacterized protein
MTLRASSYCIWVDLPETPDRMLLIHGYTGACDEVSREVGTYLRQQRTRERHKPKFGQWVEPKDAGLDRECRTPSQETLEALESRGYLTSLTPDDELAFFREIVGHIHRSESRRTSFVIVPHCDCNLRCGYCFQDAMRTDPQYRHLLKRMTPAMADRILSGIETLQPTADLPDSVPRYFTFFGGEPLLQANREVIEYFMRRAHGLHYSNFAAITNGTDLLSYRDLVGAGGVERLQITLDGPPETHDASRVYPDGRGSFEQIATTAVSRLPHPGVYSKARTCTAGEVTTNAARRGLEREVRGWLHKALTASMPGTEASYPLDVGGSGTSIRP